MAVETRKITAHLPADLLAEVQAYTGAGITETLCRGLEKLAEEERRKIACNHLLKWKGTLKEPFYDYKSMRGDD